MSKNSKKYAVIRINNNQYQVTEGEEILVDKLKEKKPKVEALLIVDNDKVKIGQPVLSKSKVEIKVIGEEKGEKIDILKYKAKSRYRKHLGFRPQYSRLHIKTITI